MFVRLVQEQEHEICHYVARIVSSSASLPTFEVIAKCGLKMDADKIVSALNCKPEKRTDDVFPDNLTIEDWAVTMPKK
ncbi:hypothetical protein KJ632_00785 [Patescibacteria group bacterium]|nr:hypothetical protein [Patescibacteria group bacterium]